MLIVFMWSHDNSISHLKQQTWYLDTGSFVSILGTKDHKSNSRGHKV